MVEHLQSGDQNMASKDSAWQAMSHFCEIGCTLQSVCVACPSYLATGFIFPLSLFPIVLLTWLCSSLFSESF